MATDGWRTGRPLASQVVDNSANFNYFQLIQLLEREYCDSENDFRFSGDLSGSFPAAEVNALEPPRLHYKTLNKKHRLLAKTGNYCIAGYSGPLPEAFSNWIEERAKVGDFALAEFIDMFTHRVNMLRFRVGARSSPQLDRRHPTENNLSTPISACLGMLSQDLYPRLVLNKRSMMSLAGLLGNQRIGSNTIQRVLTACFKVPVRIRDMVGAWRDLARDQHCKLGDQPVSTLGEMCVLGQQVWDMSARIRVHLGPLPAQTLVKFLPPGAYRGAGEATKTHSAFKDLLLYLCNRSVDAEIELEVQPETVAQPILESRSADDGAMRLGQTTWLGQPTGENCSTRFVIHAFEVGLEADKNKSLIDRPRQSANGASA